MKSVRVLIVDDSSVMRKIVERSLRQAGLDVTEVKEAAMAPKPYRYWRIRPST